MTWALHRRPLAERDALLAAAKASQADARHQQEVQTMGQTIAEALLEEGEAKGQLLAARRLLRKLLESHFGALPEALAQHIDGMTDLERIETAVVQVPRLKTLEEVQL